MSCFPRGVGVLGQFPQLKTYNHSVALFPWRDDLTQEIVISALRQATGKILKAIPWLTRQVVHTEGDNGTSGSVRVEQ